MSTMILSLPETLKSFVEERAEAGGYSSSGDYVCDLIRKDRDRHRLRALVLDGAASPRAGLANADYFDRLRNRVRETGGQ